MAARYQISVNFDLDTGVVAKLIELATQLKVPVSIVVEEAVERFAAAMQPAQDDGLAVPVSGYEVNGNADG